MSDEDDSQKTEDPTAKKLQDAYDKGQAPRSQEVRTWVMLLAGLMVVAFFSKPIALDLHGSMQGFLATPHQFDLENGGALMVMRSIVLRMGKLLALPAGLLVVAAIGASLMQGHTTFSAEKIKPKLSKLSPLAGLKKLFSVQSVVELLKSVGKFIIVGGIFALLLWPERGRLHAAISMPPDAILSLVFVMTIKLAIALVAVTSAIAMADFLFQRAQFMKKMRMSLKEQRDEHKQMEGDPLVKRKIAETRAKRSQQRIAQAVPEADVIITNPTHYAVALKYEHGNMQVPVLLAKGVDNLAARIRELAKEHDIPILENPPLARSIYATVEPDEEILPEHYQAVAKVISYILALRKKGRKPRYVP